MNTHMGMMGFGGHGHHGHHGHGHHGNGHPGHGGHGHHDGFCQGCCHPVSQCCCHHRHIQREAKELLVMPPEDATDTSGNTGASGLVGANIPPSEVLTLLSKSMVAGTNAAADIVSDEDFGKEKDEKAVKEARAAINTNATINSRLDISNNRVIPYGVGKTFIGGCCCVHLSIECMVIPQATTNLPYMAIAGVIDSDNTNLTWGTHRKEDDGYLIKEGIITTHPGAVLTLITANMAARVRWCEVFSC